MNLGASDNGFAACLFQASDILSVNDASPKFGGALDSNFAVIALVGHACFPGKHGPNSDSLSATWLDWNFIGNLSYWFMIRISHFFTHVSPDESSQT